jgi:hypothetical protein
VQDAGRAVAAGATGNRQEACKVAVPASNPHGLGIDHLLFVVNDLDRAASDFERLGFTVTPRGLHSAHLGNANHTAMLERNYLELIGVVTPTPLNQIHRDHLRTGEGCHTVALTTDSVAGTLAALRDAGIETDEPVSFSRPVKLPGGGETEASFEVVRPARAALPNGYMFFCHHQTPEAVWVDEWLSHPNGARRLSAVVVASEDPPSSAAVYRKLFAAPRERQVEDGIVLCAAKADLEFLLPDRIAVRYGVAGVASAGSPFFKVARIEVGDPARTRALLEERSVPVATGATGSLLVPPGHACGAVLEFVGGDR